MASPNTNINARAEPKSKLARDFKSLRAGAPLRETPANDHPPALVAVPFYGDQIVTFDAPDGPRVVMRRVVENMGLGWGSQRQKLVAQPNKFACDDIVTHDTMGRPQEMLTMPVAKLPLWLATINPNKVRADLQPKVELYQAESAVALHDYWTKGVAMRGDLDGIVTGLDPKVASQIGGIIKGIVHNQLSVILPQLVQAAVLSDHYIAVRGLTAGEVLDMAGFSDRKGMRQLAGAVSGKLRPYHASRNVIAPKAKLGRSEAYVFDRALCREWLDTGGRKMIEMKIAEIRGQGVLKLVRR